MMKLTLFQMVLVLILERKGAEIVINEVKFISPNSPDTEEFIELKQTGGRNDMNGYRLAIMDTCTGKFVHSCKSDSQ